MPELRMVKLRVVIALGAEQRVFVARQEPEVDVCPSCVITV